MSNDGGYVCLNGGDIVSTHLDNKVSPPPLTGIDLPYEIVSNGNFDYIRLCDQGVSKVLDLIDTGTR